FQSSAGSQMRLGPGSSGTVPGGGKPGAVGNAAAGAGNRAQIRQADCEGQAGRDSGFSGAEEDGGGDEEGGLFYYLRGEDAGSPADGGGLYSEKITGRRKSRIRERGRQPADDAL